MYKKQIGSLGENLAAEYLRSLDYKIVEQNYYSRYGEIDIIAKLPNQNSDYAFIEVKTRRSNSHGLAEESFRRGKINKIIKTIFAYLSQNKKNINWRLDLITIQLAKDFSVESLNHYKNLS